MLIQIDSTPTLIPLLITTIITLAGTIVFLFAYIKQLTKEAKASVEKFNDKIQEIYRDQIRDSRIVIEKNTEAFIKHTEAVRASAEISKELKNTITSTNLQNTTALQELKYWLRDNYGHK